MRNTYLKPVNFLEESQQLLLISSEEAAEIVLVDPRTLGVLETFQVFLCISATITIKIAINFNNQFFGGVSHKFENCRTTLKSRRTCWQFLRNMVIIEHLTKKPIKFLKKGHILGFQCEKNVFSFWNISEPRPFVRAGCLERLSAGALSHNQQFYIGGSFRNF